MKKAKSLLLVVSILLLTTSLVALPITTAQDSAYSQSDLNTGLSEVRAETLADQIILGLISEKKFLKMRLSFMDTLKVFKKIRDKRGWTVGNDGLEVALRKNEKRLNSPVLDSPSVMVSGPCNDFLELENGSTYTAYPVYRISPNPGECGPDSDDIILVYNTPKWPNTNSSSVRVWSLLWWVRWAISGCYGGVSANSLCTTGTRVCIGSCANWLGNDLNYLYLWHK